MKKKLMMVAVLMGALTLGACVDNNETQSVTDVRNAKAEQLKARADMNNAEAEALNVLAAAEAQLMNAKAAAAKANAAMANAEAATINKKAELVALQKEAAELENEAAKIENQKAQAALEAALSDLEVAKKKAEQQLDSIAGQLEADKLKWEAELAAAKQALSIAEQDLITTQDQVSATEKAKLLALASAYSQAVNNLISAQKSLVFYKNQLLIAEEGLVSVEEQKAEAILANNNAIAEWELEIAAYKEYHNYLESATIDSLQAELTKLNAQGMVLEDAYNNALKLYNDAEIDNDTISSAFELIKKDAVYQMISNRVIVLTDEEGNEDLFRLNSEDCTMQLTHFIPSNITTSAPKEYTYESEEYNIHWNEFIGDSLILDNDELDYDIRQIELDINENIERWGGYLEGYEKTLANLQAQYNGKATEVIGYDADGKEIVKEIRNAVDSTAYLKNAYEKETDATKKATLRAEYEAAIAREADLLDDIDLYTTLANMDSRKVAAMKAWLEIFLNWDANIAALNEKIENYNNVNVIAHKAKVEAWYVQTEANIAVLANDAAKSIITTQLNSNYGTGATQLENYIKQREKWIADAKKDNEDLSSIESQEELVEYAKMRVAVWEAVAAAREVAVADAKAALDAAMPKEEE